MMDILTVLLLFLLKSFVVDGEVVTPPPGVELPTSTSDTPPEATLVIAISKDAILVAGEQVTTVAEAMAGDDLLIEALDDRLDRALTQMEELAAMRGKEVSGAITIQGDQNMEFQLLQRVMYTCSFSGFDELALAVILDSRGA